MVFESLVADLLNQYLSKYVENVDHSQLQIRIWGGDAILENLLLKEGALDKLDLPIKTTYGQLAKLVLKIPWTNLYTAPVLISVERLFLLAVPNRDIKYDAIKEEQWLQAAKDYKLHLYNEMKRKRREANKPVEDDTFAEKLIAQIIKNIEIKVESIHIRYEDRVTNVEHPFSCGITLSHFYLHTTDENWEETVIEEDVTKVNKKMVIESLAIYWNCNCKLFKDRREKENKSFMTLFEETVCTNKQRPKGFQYILEPINATMCMIMNTKPELYFYKIPKYDIDIHLETLGLGMNRFQYCDMVRLGESLNRMALAAPYRKYRPQLYVYHGHFKVWWKFAYVCVLEEQIRRVRNSWKWEHISLHRRRCRAYAEAYMNKIMAIKVSKEQETKVRVLEKQLDVFNILLIRERVEMEVEKAGLLQSVPDKSGRWVSWIQSFWGSSSDYLDSENFLESMEKGMSPREKEKLFRAIGYQNESEPVNYPSSFISTHIKFNLDNFLVEITDKGRIHVYYRVMNLAFTKVSLDMEQRPIGNGLRASIKIFSLSLHGLKQRNIIPILVTPKDQTINGNLLDVLFELNPMDHACDHRLKVMMKSLQIVLDSKTIQKIIDVFRSPFGSSTLLKLQSQLTTVRDMSATGLQYVVEKQAVLELKIDVKAPFIIVPHKGFYTNNEDILVVNLGRVTISSFPRNFAKKNVQSLYARGVSEETIKQTMVSLSYEKFFLNIEHIQVLVVLKGEDWNGVFERNEVTPLHILEPFCFIVIFNNCLIRDDPKMPKAKVTANVREVAINLTNVRIMHLAIILASIPALNFGEEEEPEEEVVLNLISQRTDFQLMQAFWDAKGKRQIQEEGMKEKQEQVNVYKPQAILLDLYFELEQITVKGFIVEGASLSFETTSKFFNFKLYKIEMELVQLTFDLDLTARLGGIYMSGYDVRKKVRLIDTPMIDKHGEIDYLLTIAYTQIDKQSPDLLTKHNSTLQIVKINFTTLTLVLHEEWIISLVQVIHNVKLNVYEEGKPVVVDEKEKYVQSFRNRFKDAQRKVIYHVRERKLADIIKHQEKQTQDSNAETSLIVKVFAKKMQVIITTRSTLIADITFSDCHAHVTFSKQLTKLGFRLKNIQVLDCHPKSLHSYIMSVVHDDIIFVELVKYHVSTLLISKNKAENPDMDLTAKLGSIRIIYLQRFILSLLTFYNNVKVVSVIFKVETPDVNSLPTEKYEDNARDADFIQLSLTLDEPILTLPLNSRSMEAVMLHLGYLTITNTCQILSIVNGNGVAAAIDSIEMKLENIKGNRVLLNANYEVINEIEILHPFSFQVEIQRNLSLSWHKFVSDCEIDIRVPEIIFTITEEDCKMAMSILNMNFAEGDEVQVLDVDDIDFKHLPKVVSNKGHAEEFDSESCVETEREEEASNSPISESVKIVQKISFALDGITINLFSGGIRSQANLSNQNPTVDFIQFSIQSLYLGSVVFSNGGRQLSFVLGNCCLDDVRIGTTYKYRRLMTVKDDLLLMNQGDTQDTNSNEDTTSFYLMSITYLQKSDHDSFVDIRVRSFELIVNLEFVSEVKEFYVKCNKHSMGVHMEQREANSRKVSFSNSFSSSLFNIKNHNAVQVKKNPASMFVNIQIENPTIVFVESIDNADINALFLEIEIVSRIQFFRRKTVINAYGKDLGLYVCCFDPQKRRDTKSMILRPCTFSMLYKAQPEELHIDICTTDIRVSFTPGTLDLIRKIYFAMYESSIEASVGNDAQGDISELWLPKQIEFGKFWFLKKERHLRRLSQPTSAGSKPTNVQICTVSVPSMMIEVEAGHGIQRQPLVLLELKLECIVYDWSSDLNIHSDLAIESAYYNTRRALWEPLLEPVEREIKGRSSHHPWELSVVIQLNKQSPVTSHTLLSYSTEDEFVPQPAAVCITLTSSEPLEVTLTKTGMAVLTNLSKVLFEPSAASASVGASAPYNVINTLGIPVTVILHEGLFKLKEQDYTTNLHEVKLESGDELGLFLDKDDATPLLMDSKMSNTSIVNQLPSKGIYLYVRIGTKTRSRVLALPMFRADTRYFSLKRERGIGFGLVSDVKICNGGTILTLRSVLKVHNHTKQPIEVYYRDNEDQELISAGVAKPDTELFLPLHCTFTKELFFRVKDYKTSLEPFVWSHLKNIDMFTKLLHCPSLGPMENMPIFINVVGTSRPVVYENTNHFTPHSTIYRIHVNPAVILRNLLPVEVLVCVKGSNFKEVTQIKAGGNMHIVYVEPMKSTILLEIPCYCGKKWVCTEQIQLATSTTDFLLFTADEANKEGSLQLQIHRDKKGGTTYIQLSSQFWLINKSGLTIYYRQYDNHRNSYRDDYDNNSQLPILFSFWGAPKAKQTISIKVENGDWSDKFSLEAAGSSGVISCKIKGMVYKIGVEINLLHSKLTKKVIFSPFYILVNNHQKCIECQEVGQPDSPWTTIAPDDCIPFWPSSLSHNCKELLLRFENSTDLSIPFPFSVVHSTLLKLGNNGGVFVDVHKIEAAVFITFLPYKPGLAPTLLINHTEQTLRFYEEREEDVQVLKAGETVMITWSNPGGSKILHYILWKKKVFPDNLQTDGVEELVSEVGETVYWSSFLDGFQRVTVFTTNYNVAQMAEISEKIDPISMAVTFSIPSIGISLVNNKTMKEIIYISATNSNIIWKASSSGRNRFKPLSKNESNLLEEAFQQYHFEKSMGLNPNKLFKIGSNLEVDMESKNVVQPANMHLQRSYENGVWVEMKMSQHQSTFRGKLNSLQVDNQLFDSVFPVLFAPVHLPKTLRHRISKAFVEFRVVRRNQENNPVKHYRYFKVLIQEFQLKLDMNFLTELFEFLGSGELSEEEEEYQFAKEFEAAMETLKAIVFTLFLREEKNFYNYVHVSPLKMHISFSLSAKGVNSKTPNFIMALLRGLGVTLTDVHDVVLKIDYFERKNTFSTYNEMYAEVYSHYINEFLKNAYVLIFGLDLIGNPWGFLMGLGKGVHDLFYEPYLGAVQGPGEFGRGMLVGVGSFFGSAVGGICGAVSRISGALGTGVAVLTFDSEFQRKRKENMNKAPPSIRTRLIKSGMGLVMGVVDGVSGVVMKPVKGASHEGVLGCFKGMGQGIAGLVTRPTVGVFDFVSGTFNVVSSSSRGSNPVRPPRFLHPDGQVRPYAHTLAEGYTLLRKVEKGRFAATDEYVYHVRGVSGKRSVLLLTDKRIMHIHENIITLEYSLHWACPWEQIKPPYFNGEGIFEASCHTKRKRFTVLCGKSNTLIPIEPSQRRILVHKIKELTDSHNYTRNLIV